MGLNSIDHGLVLKFLQEVLGIVVVQKYHLECEKSVPELQRLEVEWGLACFWIAP